MKANRTNPFNATASRMTQILVVEDEYIIATNLQENLESLGYGVLDVANSGAEGIAKATALRPDLVLMDIQLHGEMDGIQAAEQIWQQLQIPVIYVTGHSDQSTLERAQMTFPFGYILKPVKSKELYVAIQTALSRYEREQLLSTVLRSIGDGMIVTNTQGRVMFLNVAAEQLTGWQQEEARDRDLLEVFNVIDEETRLPIDNVAAIAVQQDVTLFLNERVLLIRKDGTTLPLSDSVAPIKNHQGLITGAVLIFRNDTQRRLQEQHKHTLEQTQVLQRQNEELQRLDRLKDDFLSMVSHELRTPLVNMRMAIQMLEITLDRQEAAETATTTRNPAKYVQILRDQCNQELNLVNDLLDLQQFEAGARRLEWLPIDLNECLAQSTAAFQDRARSQKQQLQALVSPNLPVIISDLEILTRILRELLMNACKYTPPGGSITVSAETEERLETDASSKQANQLSQSAKERVVQIRVCNSGVEIPADELTRIFDKFYRIPASDRWKQGGTGLGLGLVKQSVAHLGGAIWAESSAGETRFIVALPIAPPAN